MAWDTESILVPRVEAIEKIKEKAKMEGITGAFKVYYKDDLIVSPDDLPEHVNMSFVRVSSVYNQA